MGKSSKLEKDINSKEQLKIDPRTCADIGSYIFIR